MSLKKAALINAIAKYSVILMNIAFSAILARILTPDDYGVIAVLTIFTTLFTRISDMGFGAAVIQFRDLGKEDVNYIFSFTFWLAILLTVLFILIGIPVSLFYQNTVYRPLCFLLAVSVFFNCLNMLPNAALLRDKKFITVAVRMVLVNIVGYVVAIVSALFGAKYYALALQSVVAAISNFIWNNYTARLKLKFRFRLHPVKRVWKYGAFQFAFGWVNYFEGNLDSILIGGVMGSRLLALYDRGYKLVSYPLTSISGIITPVLHPILKDFQDDKNYLYQQYIRIQKILSVIAAGITPVLFCAGAEIIIILYGNQWTETIWVFRILAIAIYPRLMMSTTGAVYCSAGSTKMLFVAGTINAIVTGLGIIGGIFSGSIGTVAIGVAIASWSNMLVTFTILIGKVFGVSVRQFFRNLIWDIFAMIGIGMIASFFSNCFVFNQELFYALIKICLCAVLYILYLGVSGRYALIYELLRHEKKVDKEGI